MPEIKEEIVQVKFLRDTLSPREDSEVHKKDSVKKLPKSSATRWVRRNAAEIVTKKTTEKPQGAK